MISKVKTWAQLKKHPAVGDAFSEYGNLHPDKHDYWVYLKSGYISEEMECGVIHEQTKSACIRMFNETVVKLKPTEPADLYEVISNPHRYFVTFNGKRIADVFPERDGTYTAHAIPDEYVSDRILIASGGKLLFKTVACVVSNHKFARGVLNV